MQLPLAYLDVSVVEAVPIELWRRVFDEVGWPSSLDNKRSALTHVDILDAFQRDILPDGLLLAFDALNWFGTEAGRAAIVAAMRNCHVPAEALPSSVSEKELALHLFLGQLHDPALADVSARAETELQSRGDYKRYNDFLGKEARAVKGLESKRRALHEKMIEHSRNNDLGDYVEVRAFEDDGVCVFQVIRSHRTKRPLVVVSGRRARATIEYRPVHGDLLRYDPATGRLRVYVRIAAFVDVYRQMLGEVLFGDEDFFPWDSPYNLRVLQERGRAALASHGMLKVGGVCMTECLWERGDRDLLNIRSPDCFLQIEELELPLIEGTLLQVTLKLIVVGRSTRPVIVRLGASGGLAISQLQYEGVVEEFLRRVGILTRKHTARDTDLWSLYPWRHPADTWRSLFGKDTDALVQQGVLKPVQLSAIPRPERGGAGNVLEVHAVPGGGLHGVGRECEVGSRSLSPTDIDGLELDTRALRDVLRERLHLSGGTDSRDHDELLDLGELTLGDQRVRVIYALRQPPRGIGDRIRVMACGRPTVLLVPSTHCENPELARVVLDTPLPSRAHVVPRIVDACGLTQVVSAIFRAPEDARLVVDTVREQVWVDGLLIAGLRPGTHAFRFVEILARASSAAVSTESLISALSPNRQDDSTVVRQAKSDAKKATIAAMAEANMAFDEDPFPPGPTGFYRSILPSFVS